MMLVSTYLDRSPIHGVGIFARDFVPKGTRVWEFSPEFDQIFTDAQLAALLPVQRDAILFYCFIEPGLDGKVLCCDNARHFNFAVDPNCGSADHVLHGFISTYALRDIAAGEELTYSVEEDADAARKLGRETGGS